LLFKKAGFPRHMTSSEKPESGCFLEKTAVQSPSRDVKLTLALADRSWGI
jgi:hypothetical protein